MVVAVQDLIGSGRQLCGSKKVAKHSRRELGSGFGSGFAPKQAQWPFSPTASAPPEGGSMLDEADNRPQPPGLRACEMSPCHRW